jgi:hypothetical protein
VLRYYFLFLFVISNKLNFQIVKLEGNLPSCFNLITELAVKPSMISEAKCQMDMIGNGRNVCEAIL